MIHGLERRGYPVITPANPLRGVSADAAYLRAFLDTIEGPIVLVGHSYGGVTITNAATGNANVKALVYVAAFAPDEGDTVESLAELGTGGELGPATLDLRPYPAPEGAPPLEGYIKLDVFRDIVALLDLALGRRHQADRRLRDAIAVCERTDAQAFLAMARHDLGALLLPSPEGRRLLSQARASAERVGILGLRHSAA